jgi:hypothetical protein
MLKEDANRGDIYNGQNWEHQVKVILEELGLPYIFTEQDNVQVPLNVIQKRLNDQYRQQWRSGIKNSSRLNYYCKIKDDLAFEPYLDTVDDVRLRKMLCRFILSSHNLAIETGIYDCTPKHLIKCNYCSSGAVKTEYYFLLVCSKYTDLRKKNVFLHITVIGPPYKKSRYYYRYAQNVC